MTEAFKTILEEGRDEFTISRSRFIGWSKPVAGEKDALEFIEKIRKSHWTASHNVWAYTLGALKERYSDDGEPQGTAGLPVLDVIRKEGLKNVAIVVTRYFGGVKLGTGGLVRAYTRSASAALEAGRIIWRRPFLSFEVRAEYHFAGKLEREFVARGYYIKGAEYLEFVTFSVLIPPDEKDGLYTLIADLTAGKGAVTAGPEEFLDYWQGERIV